MLYKPLFFALVSIAFYAYLIHTFYTSDQIGVIPKILDVAEQMRLSILSFVDTAINFMEDVSEAIATFHDSLGNLTYASAFDAVHQRKLVLRNVIIDINLELFDLLSAAACGIVAWSAQFACDIYAQLSVVIASLLPYLDLGLSSLIITFNLYKIGCFEPVWRRVRPSRNMIVAAGVSAVWSLIEYITGNDRRHFRITTLENLAILPLFFSTIFSIVCVFDHIDHWDGDLEVTLAFKTWKRILYPTIVFLVEQVKWSSIKMMEAVRLSGATLILLQSKCSAFVKSFQKPKPEPYKKRKMSPPNPQWRFETHHGETRPSWVVRN